MQQGEMVISGQVVEGGVECPLFQTDDGQTFALAGFNGDQPSAGTRLRLRGQIAEVSTCMQGTAFAVTEILN